MVKTAITYADYRKEPSRPDERIVGAEIDERARKRGNEFYDYYRLVFIIMQAEFDMGVHPNNHHYEIAEEVLEAKETAYKFIDYCMQMDEKRMVKL